MNGHFSARGIRPKNLAPIFVENIFIMGHMGSLKILREILFQNQKCIRLTLAQLLPSRHVLSLTQKCCSESQVGSPAPGTVAGIVPELG